MYRLHRVFPLFVLAVCSGASLALVPAAAAPRVVETPVLHLEITMCSIATRDLRGAIEDIQTPMPVLGSWYGLRAFSTREAVEAGRGRIAKETGR